MNALQIAHRVKARKIAQIARELGRTYQTVSRWISGKSPVPELMRGPLAEALGAAVDWAAYDAERQTLTCPPEAQEAPPEAHKPIPAHHHRPAPPSRPTARPAAPAGFSPPPPRSGGFLSSIFD